MLKNEVIRHVKKEMDANAKKAEAQLLLHIEAQKAFMNTRHPDFNNPYKQGTLSGAHEVQTTHHVITGSIPENGQLSDEQNMRERKMSIAQRHVSPPSNSSFFVPTEHGIKALVYILNNCIIANINDLFSDPVPFPDIISHSFKHT